MSIFSRFTKYLKEIFKPQTKKISEIDLYNLKISDLQFKNNVIKFSFIADYEYIIYFTANLYGFEGSPETVRKVIDIRLDLSPIEQEYLSNNTFYNNTSNKYNLFKQELSRLIEEDVVKYCREKSKEIKEEYREQYKLIQNKIVLTDFKMNHTTSNEKIAEVVIDYLRDNKGI